MSNLRHPAAQPPKRSIPPEVSDRAAFVLNGALIGFLVGVGMLMAIGPWNVDFAPLWVLVAVTTIGSLTGLDLYLTRNWRRFGRFTPMIRFEVACVGAAGLTSAVGAVLGLIPHGLAWGFTGFGAIGGLLYGIYILGTSA